ncbi:TRAP transporter fused permease subunit [Pelagibius sp. 7325]|uniref:TRAP transporter permease n=1 Tax=Pelagibius sp. 7325 TaxID=3131994 RepID=UPI0030EBCCB5
MNSDETVTGQGWAKATSRVLVALLLGYVCWSVFLGQLPNIQHRAIILGGCLILATLHFVAKRRNTGMALVDIALLMVALGACLYAAVEYWDYMLTMDAASDLALALGVGLIVVLIEFSRRMLGLAFAILFVIFTLYTVFGHHLSGKFGHGEVHWYLLVESLFLSTDGIWGTLMDIFVSMLILFVAFSSAMLSTGAAETFITMAKSVGGRYRGGPAKIAVIASAAMGTITGSSVSNVAMTGNFTIPMMKRLGYRPEVAAGVEATASSGGQITPPLMGAGLFLMAEMLDVPITHMMLVALVPALLFFIGVFFSIHFESARQGIGALPKEEIPPFSSLSPFSVWAPVMLPFLTLLGAIVAGYSVGLSVLGALALLVALHLVKARSLGDLAARLKSLVGILDHMAMPLATLAVLVAVAGLLVGTINIVNVGAKFSDVVLGLGEGSQFLSILLAAAVVMIMGMGMPTTAAYVLAASVIALSLQSVGLSELQAHMFIFYFATLSAITPPVCTAVFVAAGIAEAPWTKVALHTMRIAIVKYILPFAFVFQPALLLMEGTEAALYTFVIAALGCIVISGGFSGYLLTPLSRLERWLLCAAGTAAILCPPLFAVAALAFAAAVQGGAWLRGRRTATLKPGTDSL